MCETVLNGLSGEVIVNGQSYNGVMPKLTLSDADIANVMTYILNNWDNKGGEVSADKVSRLRKTVQ